MYMRSRSCRFAKWVFTISASVAAMACLLSGWWALHYESPNNLQGPMVSFRGATIFYWNWETPTGRRAWTKQNPDAGLTLQRTRWYRSGIPVPDFDPPFPVGSIPFINGVSNYTSRLAFPVWPIPLALGIMAIVLWRRDRYPPGFCSRCGYNLTGNMSGVCSECGAKLRARVSAITTHEKLGT